MALPQNIYVDLYIHELSALCSGITAKSERKQNLYSGVCRYLSQSFTQQFIPCLLIGNSLILLHFICHQCLAGGYRLTDCFYLCVRPDEPSLGLGLLRIAPVLYNNPNPSDLIELNLFMIMIPDHI